MNYSGNGDFNAANGNSMDLGSGNSDGTAPRDGTRPPSARWLFAVLVWEI